MKRKVMIVVEETGEHGGAGFNIYLSGDAERIGFVPQEQLTPAEWWGQRLFGTCIVALREAGVIKSEMKRESTSSHEKRH